MTLSASGVVGLTVTAQAAPEDIELTITSIENETNPGQSAVLGDILWVSGTWDATNADPQPGDQYTVGLPPELDLYYAIGATFEKTGPADDGSTHVWSICEIRAPKTLTCTLQDAVADYPEFVQGDFGFLVEAVGTTDSDTVEFDLNGTPGEGELPGGGSITDGVEIPGTWSKNGGWNDGASDRSRMTWTIEVPGPALQASGKNPVVITDVISGTHQLCSLDEGQFSVTTVREGTPSAAAPGDISYDFTDSRNFTIELAAPFAADRTYVITYDTCTTSEEIDPTGTVYDNTATISIDGLDGDGIGQLTQDWAAPSVWKNGSNVSRDANNDSVYGWTVQFGPGVAFGQTSLTLEDTLTGAHELFTDGSGDYVLEGLRIVEREGHWSAPNSSTNITSELTLTPNIAADGTSFELDITIPGGSSFAFKDYPYWYEVYYQTRSTYEGLPPGGTVLSNEATIGGLSNGAEVTIPNRPFNKGGNLNDTTVELGGETYLPYTTLSWRVNVPGEQLEPYDSPAFTGPLVLTDTLEGEHMVCTYGDGTTEERLGLRVQAIDQVGNHLPFFDLVATAVVGTDGEITFTLEEPTDGWNREYRYQIDYTTCTTSGGMDPVGTHYGNSITGVAGSDTGSVTQNRRGGGTGTGRASMGSISISKSLTDDSVAIPEDTVFTVLVEEYAPGTYPDGDPYETYTLEVPLNGDPVNGQNARGNGWIFVLSEPSFPDIPGIAGFTPVFSDSDRVVAIEEDTKAEVTIEPRSNAQVSLENRAVVPSIDIQKWNNEGTVPLYDASGAITNDGFDGDYDTAPGKALEADAELQLTFTISNDGNEALEDIVVSDELTDGSGAVQDLECLFPDNSTGTTWTGPFEVGTQFTCLGTLPALDNGESHSNTASVTGIGIESGVSVDDEDEWHGEVPSPSIDIEKWNDEGETPEYDASGALLNDGFAGDFDTAPGKALVADQPLPVNFTISNDGDESLVDIVVSDDLTDGEGAIEDLVCTFPDDTTGVEWAGPFEVGTQFECAGTLPALANGVTHQNTATVTGIGIDSRTEVDDEDEWNAYVPSPSIDIEKWNVEIEGVGPEYDQATGALLNDGYEGDFDEARGKALGAGESVEINFTISNDGDEVLEDIVVSDELTDGVGVVEGLVCAFPDGSTGVEWAGPFEVATQFTCTGTLPALGDGERHANLSSVTGIGIDSRTVVDDEDGWFGYVPGPSVGIEKWNDEGEAPEYDETGLLLNDGFDGDFDGDSAKELAAVEEIQINFTITNDGEEALTDIVITDELVDGVGEIQDLVCVFPDGTTGTTWDGVFEVGTQFDCTAVFPGLVPGESHSNNAQVNAVGVISGTAVSDEDDWNAYFEETSPSIGIEKWNDEGEAPEYDESGALINDGYDGDFDGDSAKELSAGRSLQINFTVTNDGDEDLTDIVVSDDLVDGVGEIQDLVCVFPDGTTGTTWDGVFEVGTQFDCTGTLPGLAAGDEHSNTATVTGIGIHSGIGVDDQDDWNAFVPDADGLAVSGANASALATLVPLLLLSGGAALVYTNRRRLEVWFVAH